VIPSVFPKDRPPPCTRQMTDSLRRTNRASLLPSPPPEGDLRAILVFVEMARPVWICDPATPSYCFFSPDDEIVLSFCSSLPKNQATLSEGLSLDSPRSLLSVSFFSLFQSSLCSMPPFDTGLTFPPTMIHHKSLRRSPTCLLSNRTRVYCLRLTSSLWSPSGIFFIAPRPGIFLLSPPDYW